MFSVIKIVQNLDLSKAHGHNNISIRMLKICGSSIYKPLAIIFKQCADTGIFSLLSGKRVDPIYKKGDEQTYRPVWFLLIYGKILERFMFNEMFKCFIENERISSHQSGFKPD